MFSDIDIEKKLLDQREKSANNLLNSASSLLVDDQHSELKIQHNIKNSDGFETVSLYNYDPANVFSISDIKKIAKNYLRGSCVFDLLANIPFELVFWSG